jgi:glycosyltransferase involved in cell wall biosynthesis
MRVVIDMQGAQSQSRRRGIGRYSLSLALALAKNAGSHEIWVALNAAFPESIVDIRCMLDNLIPHERIRVFEGPTPVAASDSANAWRGRVAEKIREHFLAQMNPDVIHISSLFEGWVDDAVTSVGAFVSGENTTVTLYDLIPFFYQHIYLPVKAQRDYYFRKMQSLKNAGMLFAISEFARREAIDALELPEERVVNISAAVEDRFRPIELPPDRIDQLRTRYGIQRNIIMYAPGGFEMRKNIDSLIRAFAWLPADLRAQHQLVMVSKLGDHERSTLQKMRRQARLAEDELVLTGYVSDDDLVGLYNLTSLFVFPSKHEGFGLPVLEAMACGAPTIGSNTTSIPEVIGSVEALFNPSSVQSIADKIARILRNDGLRNHLREHGLRQAKTFSWDKTAKRAIAAFETLHSQKTRAKPFSLGSARRPKLAYVSPLPPERSGISDYSAELLPDLARYYEIEVIVRQRTVSHHWIDSNFPVRSVDWFQQNASAYERVLYHFGNSPFHSHMFSLLRQYPGVVVLHDFFLSWVLSHEEITANRFGAWTHALYHSHGYRALLDRYTGSEVSIARDRYPCNLEVLQNARGVIVHSEYSRRLARHWYSERAADAWAVIRAVKKTFLGSNRFAARKRLGISDDVFLVCSFGFTDFTKCNDRLIDAWCASRLATDDRCVLIFVGENHGGEYGQQLYETIRRQGLENRIIITGWTDVETYNNYLSAADVGVQLRRLSRGEASRAILDCMNYGLATITNANGSTGELPRDAVWMLPDEFTDAELSGALEMLWQDAERRRQLGVRAREEICANHNPRSCANQYARSIETMYRHAVTDRHALVKAIAASNILPADHTSLGLVAKSIAVSSLPQPLQRQLLVDVSSIARDDLKTGIERVIIGHLLELIKDPPAGFRVEPVYLTDRGGEWHYRYARSYTCQTLGIEQLSFPDAPIDISPGDVFYGADYHPSGVIEAAKSDVYSKWRAAGVSINVLVYDLLPILRPEFFPDGASIIHKAWLGAIAEFACRIICISNAVADDLRSWLDRNPPARKDLLRIAAVHLGADPVGSKLLTDLPNGPEEMLHKIGSGPIFLMIGTIEPRKGYLQAMAAFEQLWAEGLQISLVIVGKEGWRQLPNGQRRTIRKIVDTLRKHPELGSRLFWLGRVSDDILINLYRRVDALLMASEAEGFGLPLIEAAQHGLPIISRDLPVFREVAGENAYYFDGSEPESLADSLRDWLSLRAAGRVPQSKDMRRLTWRESTQNLLAAILPETEVSPTSNAV